MITLRWHPPGMDSEIEVSGENTLEVFEAIVDVMSVFGFKECGACKSPILPTRNAPKDSAGKRIIYHKWSCQNPECRANLTLHKYDPEKGKTGLYSQWNDEWYVPEKREG